KKTKISEFRGQSRGGSGVKAMGITAKTGSLVAAKILWPETEEFVAVSEKGKTLRSSTKEIPSRGRATQGVRLMRLEDKDKLSSIALLDYARV
ncbi:MAG: DNA gyrase subunit A, partial [Candidatus Ryanbacteria bacterium]|nr:DNA gyrase subunit A [Candidatus Ryanbacteria bacterium]